MSPLHCIVALCVSALTPRCVRAYEGSKMEYEGTFFHGGEEKRKKEKKERKPPNGVTRKPSYAARQAGGQAGGRAGRQLGRQDRPAAAAQLEAAGLQNRRQLARDIL